MKTRFILSAAGIAAALLLPAAFPVLAQSTVVCGHEATGCTKDEVGPFMQGVSAKCGNVGDCEISDIETVIANIGNWILGIVGALVLLFYVWGGIQFLTSGSGATSVKEGKETIKKATVGLVIVFVAFAAITTLKNSLDKTVAGGSTGNYADCKAGKPDEGKPCAQYSTCMQIFSTGKFACISGCDAKNLTSPSALYECVETKDMEAGIKQERNCTANQCPGSNTFLCCTKISPTP